ncbi:MAG: hypothetical protein M3179_07090 [Actinomycetota bacterium]|nr:hypothetical protein [Actinomycetota bacterium]
MPGTCGLRAVYTETISPGFGGLQGVGGRAVVVLVVVVLVVVVAGAAVVLVGDVVVAVGAVEVVVSAMVLVGGVGVVVGTVVVVVSAAVVLAGGAAPHEDWATMTSTPGAVMCNAFTVRLVPPVITSFNRIVSAPMLTDVGVETTAPSGSIPAPLMTSTAEDAVPLGPAVH